MNHTTQLETQLLGVGEIISRGRHAVPIYQRSYAWRASHVDDLFSDFATAVYEKEDEYFLGSIVLTRAGVDDPEVVDGQQRLATTMILLAAIRDYLVTNEYEIKGTEIERQYLLTRELRTDEILPRLKLNILDNDFFVDSIITSPNDRSDRQATIESHRRIKEAADLAKRRVQTIAESAGAKAVDSLIDWVEFINRKAKLICVIVPNHANAFTIFETLNDRGLTLAISDLLKNYLFSRADDRLPEAQANWIAMGSVLESVGGDEIVVEFIRHLWSSKHGLVREKQLYKDIRKRANSKARCVDFTKDLESHAKTYSAILNPGHPFWKPYGDVARGYIAAMNALQVKEIRPLVLAVITHFTHQQAVMGLRLIVSCAIRSLLVKGRAGILESHYCATAKEISEGKIKKERQLRDRMREVIPGDSEFQQSFAIASSSNTHRVRYILREIESYLNVETPEWVPSNSVDDVSLEHVLPRNLSPEWSEFDDDTHRSFLNRFGNLAILASSDNSALGNAEFKKKKKAFKSSSFETTSMIAKDSAWTSEAIIARQIVLSKYAVKTWPLSGEKRKPMKKPVKKKAARKKS